MRAIGHLMERLAAAEHHAAQKRNRRLGRLSTEQILILDAFFKQVMALDDAARASRSADLMRQNPEIAVALMLLDSVPPREACRPPAPNGKRLEELEKKKLALSLSRLPLNSLFQLMVNWLSLNVPGLL